MPDFLDNPPAVVWSHSDSKSDFYELATDGAEMYSALGWLLQHYHSVKLWMGVESDEGTELYLTASPTRKADIVDRLRVYHDEVSIFGPEVAILELESRAFTTLPASSA